MSEINVGDWVTVKGKDFIFKVHSFGMGTVRNEDLDIVEWHDENLKKVNVVESFVVEAE